MDAGSNYAEASSVHFSLRQVFMLSAEGRLTGSNSLIAALTASKSKSLAAVLFKAGENQ